jgi:transcriptional regulator with XRE-family HTH domain
MLTPDQSRAARALINWSQPQLAGASGVSVSTIRDFETGKRAPIGNNLAAMQRALEAAGVIFVSENGEGPGVRLRKTGKAAQAADKPKAEAIVAKGADARRKARGAVEKALADVPATDEEKAKRKRRLTKVPRGLKPRGK